MNRDAMKADECFMRSPFLGLLEMHRNLSRLRKCTFDCFQTHLQIDMASFGQFDVLESHSIVMDDPKIDWSFTKGIYIVGSNISDYISIDLIGRLAYCTKRAITQTKLTDRNSPDP